MRALNHTVRLGAAIVLAMVLGSYLFSSTAEGSELRDLRRINGGVEVIAGEPLGHVSSVNGSVVVQRHAIADEVETVNGRIELRQGSRVRNAATVNGGIRVESDVQVDGNLRTVNGGILLRRGSAVSGHVRTVNGKISLRSVRVGDYLRTTNGDIELSGSVVDGDIIIRGGQSWFTRLFHFGHEHRPDLVIDADSVVRGTIYLYREVDLRIDDDAEIGAIEHRH